MDGLALLHNEKGTPCSLFPLSVCVCVCVNAQAFSVVFEMAIMTTEPAEEVKQRVLNLIDEITYSVFMYTNRSLFEKDKLTFIAQISFQVNLWLVWREWSIYNL